MATHCSILAWKIPWTEKPVMSGSYILWLLCRQRVRHNWALANEMWAKSRGSHHTVLSLTLNSTIVESAAAVILWPWGKGQEKGRETASGFQNNGCSHLPLSLLLCDPQSYFYELHLSVPCHFFQQISLRAHHIPGTSLRLQWAKQKRTHLVALPFSTQESTPKRCR